MTKNTLMIFFLFFFFSEEKYSCECSKLDQINTYGDEEIYKERTNEAIKMAVSLLEEEENISMMTLMNFFAEKRFQLAREMKTIDSSEFGQIRMENDESSSTPRVTPIRGKYASYLRSRKNIWAKIVEKKFYITQYKGMELTTLTTLNFTKERSNLSDTIEGTIVHTILENSKKLQNEAAELFSKIMLAPKIDFRELGRLHWLLAHAMIYKRGSAAITENLITAIIYKRTGNYITLKKDLDLDAFMECLDDFSSQYEERHRN